MVDAEKPPRRDELRAWRRRSTAGFWAIVAVFCVACTVQVALQLFTPTPPAGPEPTCEAGTNELAASLDRGWTVAQREDDEPEKALDRFRSAVAESWRSLPAVQRACRGEAKAAARLDALERLRYALESRVRVDGGSLTALRRRALGAAPNAAGETALPSAPAGAVP